MKTFFQYKPGHILTLSGVQRLSYGNGHIALIYRESESKTELHVAN